MDDAALSPNRLVSRLGSPARRGSAARRRRDASAAEVMENPVFRHRGDVSSVFSVSDEISHCKRDDREGHVAMLHSGRRDLGPMLSIERKPAVPPVHDQQLVLFPHGDVHLVAVVQLPHISSGLALMAPSGPSKTISLGPPSPATATMTSASPSGRLTSPVIIAVILPGSSRR